MNEQMHVESIIVIAGGSTVKSYDISDIKKHGFVIGVNEAAVLADCHVGLTMDRMWAEQRIDQLKIPLWVRKDVVKNFTLREYDVPFHNDYKSIEFAENQTTPIWLNGTNSGFCALNLAYLMKPRRLYLLGFDMIHGPDGEPYWYPPYPWAAKEGGTKPGRYALWSKQFQCAARSFAQKKVEVFNVTHRSAIDVFRKISFKQFIRGV